MVVLGAIFLLGVATGYARHAAGADPPPDDAVPVDLGELFVRPVGPRGPELTGRVRALAGRRVRMRGYVVRQERPMPDRFLLTPRPMVLHEEEYGLADDLPAATVLVLDAPPPGSASHATAPVLVVVTGTLEIGNREEPDGRVSLLRLHADRPPAAGTAAPDTGA